MSESKTFLSTFLSYRNDPAFHFGAEVHDAVKSVGADKAIDAIASHEKVSWDRALVLYTGFLSDLHRCFEEGRVKTGVPLSIQRHPNEVNLASKAVSARGDDVAKCIKIGARVVIASPTGKTEDGLEGFVSGFKVYPHGHLVLVHVQLTTPLHGMKSSQGSVQVGVKDLDFLSDVCYEVTTRRGVVKGAVPIVDDTPSSSSSGQSRFVKMEHEDTDIYPCIVQGGKLVQPGPSLEDVLRSGRRVVANASWSNGKVEGFISHYNLMPGGIMAPIVVYVNVRRPTDSGATPVRGYPIGCSLTHEIEFISEELYDVTLSGGYVTKARRSAETSLIKE